MSPKRRKLLLAVLACGLLVTVAAFFLLRESEPSYKGKPLSAWLAQMYSGVPIEDQRLALKLEAQDAIRAIGTNALPYLIEGISTPPHDFAYDFGPRRGTLEWVVEKVPALTKSQRLRTWLNKDAFKPLASVDAFQALGPVAAPAIPVLTNLLITSTNFGVLLQTSTSLAHIGPLALPPLVEIITNHHSAGRPSAIYAIGYMRTRASVATPTLIQCLYDTDSRVAHAAATALGDVDTPDLAVPALTNFLSTITLRTNHEFTLVMRIVHSLKRYGLKAPDVAPALVQYLKNHQTSDTSELLSLDGVLRVYDSPEINSPVLADYLVSTNAVLAGWSSLCLVGLGRPALPALTNALQDSTGTLHLAISNTIDEIVFPRPKPQFE